MRFENAADVVMYIFAAFGALLLAALLYAIVARPDVTEGMRSTPPAVAVIVRRS